jgi:hypothetical protein
VQQETAQAPQADPRFKIAIIGKAPSSRLIAPYDDPSWEIWSLSDNYNVIPRWDRWFEIHDLDRYKELYPPYYDWMAALPAGGKPLYISEARAEIPAGVPFPWQQLVAKYGRYFTNTISWQIVFAIEELRRLIQAVDGAPSGSEGELTPEDYRRHGAMIGIWGVDMATNTEYAHQRPSCEYFMGWVKGLGIELLCPDECDMLKVARMYGIEAFRGELDRKIRVRQHELRERQAKMQHELGQAERAAMVMAGADQELANLEQLVGQANPDLLKFLQQRRQGLTGETQNVTIARDQLAKSVHMITGALEDLKWTQQWA